MKRLYRAVAIFIAFSALFFAFQNCTKGFETASKALESQDSTANTSSFEILLTSETPSQTITKYVSLRAQFSERIVGFDASSLELQNMVVLDIREVTSETGAAYEIDLQILQEGLASAAVLENSLESIDGALNARSNTFQTIYGIGEPNLLSQAPATSINFYSYPYFFGSTMAVLSDATVRTIDVTDPSQIAVMGNLTYGDPLSSLTGSGSHLYVLKTAGDVDSLEFSVVVVSLPDPNTPAEVASIMLPAGPRFSHLEVRDDRLYVLGNDILVFDITEAGAPQLVQTVANVLPLNEIPSNFALDLASDKMAANVSSGAQTTVLFDIADISNPVRKASLPHLGAFGLHIRDNKLIGASMKAPLATSGLVIYDIENLDAPTVIGEIENVGPSYSMAVHRHHVYLGMNLAGIAVIDIFNLANPILVERINDTENTRGTAVYKGVLYFESMASPSVRAVSGLPGLY